MGARVAVRQDSVTAVADWLAMGGHGVFVWSAYALSFAALVGICVAPLLRMRTLLRRLRRRLAEEGVAEEETG